MIVSQYEVPLVRKPPDLNPAQSPPARIPMAAANRPGDAALCPSAKPGQRMSASGQEPFLAHTTMVYSMISADEGFHQSAMGGHGQTSREQPNCLSWWSLLPYRRGGSLHHHGCLLRGATMGDTGRGGGGTREEGLLLWL